jgi:poly-gamma-glutamate biosynthesis protein PgsC/CapC
MMGTKYWKKLEMREMNMFDKVIIIGIFISLAYSEITGFSPSGLIVPGYIAVNINNPSRIISTLCISLITYLLLKLLSKYTIIYGKRQFALAVGIALVINIFSTLTIPFSLGIIGNIIPGIIANEWLKEGMIVSLVSLSVVVLIIVTIMIISGMPVF